MVDQALFAGSNFLLNVLLARWLHSADYGAFTIAFSTFLLIGTYYTAVLVEPMLVFGAGKYQERLSEYFGILLQGHLAFVLPASLLLALVGMYFRYTDSLDLAAAFFGLALAQPFILLLRLTRRACYARLNPRLATIAGGVYLVTMLASLAVLYAQEWLSILTALATLAVASLLSGSWIILRLGVRSPIRVDHDLRSSVIREHWKYGRWSASTCLLTWIPGNIYYYVLPLWGGLEATGVLRALQNLILPAMNFHSAIGVIWLPYLVKAREAGTFGKHIRMGTIFFVVVSVAYWLTVGLSHPFLVDWVYQGQYAEYGSLLWILGLSPILFGLNRVYGGGLRALERPDRIFWAYVVSTVVVLTIGMACIALWLIPGAIVANMLSSLATIVMMIFLLRSAVTAAAENEPRVASTSS